MVVSVGGPRFRQSTLSSDASFVPNKRLAIHRWVDWIAGFSSEFVREMLSRYANNSKELVLDPFAGVGTTLLEAYLAGYSVLGYEINPFAHMASRVKLEACSANAFKLKSSVEVARAKLLPLEEEVDRLFRVGRLAEAPVPTSKPPAGFRTRIPFFSLAVELKVLHYLDFVAGLTDPFVRDIFRLAFGSVMVSFSNYTYEPSLASRPGSGKCLIENTSVIPTIMAKLDTMFSDILEVQNLYGQQQGKWSVLRESFFTAVSLPRGAVQLVVTSPPYLNNYHYVRNTRPQMYWLGLVGSPAELRKLEEQNYGKFWQTVRDGPAVELNFRHAALEKTLAHLRSLHVEKNAYGGPGWANYAASYFNDTFRFMTILTECLKSGGYAVIVIGNSILQGVDIPVDRFFADLGEMAGLEVMGIELLRDKRVGSSIIGTGARKQSKNVTGVLYESAVIFRKR